MASAFFWCARRAHVLTENKKAGSADGVRGKRKSPMPDSIMPDYGRILLLPIIPTDYGKMLLLPIILVIGRCCFASLSTS